MIVPSSVAAGGSSFSTDNAVTDLPEPLSPTSASVSPGAISKLIFFAASNEPKRMVRSRTESRGGVKRIARFEGPP
ncbi:hypothetical protein D3C73_1595600 [compost metagenome]